jgi:hypothetical protein
MRNGYPTLREQRILATYLARINPLNPETRTIRFTFGEFAELCGLKDDSVRGMNIKEYRKIAKNILHKVVSLRTQTDGYLDFVLFSQSLIEKNPETGENYIELSASHEGMQFFFDLKQYIKFDLEIVLALKSINQIRLYELLKEHEWHKKFDIKLNELRDLLFISPHEYPLFKKFNQDVLTVCQKAINELTDINFTYTTKRVGRKVGVISFTVLPKAKAPTTSVVHHTEQFVPIKDEVKPKPPKKSTNITKKDIAEAQKSEFWYYAEYIANKRSRQKSNNITTTPEKYATGIVKKWIESGYKTIEELVASGEISKNDVKNKPSFDLNLLEQMIRDDYKNHLGMEKNNGDNKKNR